MDKLKSDGSIQDLLVSIISENLVLKANLSLCKSLFVEMLQSKGMTTEEIDIMFSKHEKAELARLVSTNEHFTDEWKEEIKYFLTPGAIKKPNG